jgi:hypothetical protein
MAWQGAKRTTSVVWRRAVGLEVLEPCQAHQMLGRIICNAGRLLPDHSASRVQYSAPALYEWRHLPGTVREASLIVGKRCALTRGLSARQLPNGQFQSIEAPCMGAWRADWLRLRRSHFRLTMGPLRNLPRILKTVKF